MSEFRIQRAEKIILEEISKMIVTGKIKDPRVNSLISLTRVTLSKDIGYAKIYVSGFCSEKQVEKSVDALNHAVGFIQGVIGKKLKTRLTPRLKFVKDDSLKNGFDVTKIIEDNFT
jgi:ribosome-binding factor A